MGHDTYHGQGKSEMVLVETLKGMRPLRIPRHIWEDNLKINLEETDVKVWTGFTWLRRGTSSRLLQI